MTTHQAVPHVTDNISERFIGRAEALSIFHALRDPSALVNGIYYYGQGGTGKTWILHKIKMEVGGHPEIQIPPIIDFYNTQNNHVHGLQTSIKERLCCPEVFEQYEKILQEMSAERAKGERANDSVVAALERIANQAFIRACIQAAQGKTIILRFDTFERVQNRYVGSWMLKSFLPQVRGLLIVLAGRPASQPAEMPGNIKSYQLPGLDRKETGLYIRKVLPGMSNHAVRTIWQRTQGVPLLIELIMDLHSPLREQFIAILDQLDKGKVLQEVPELQRTLVGQFASPASPKNRIIWAMAFLWRRFDLAMLKYTVEHGEWFQSSNYTSMLEDLLGSLYVKEYPDQESHLLHDEIQRMISRFILEEAADPVREMRDPLYDLVVNHYYVEAIQKAGETPQASQMQAEQLGYILDRSPEEGLRRYEIYKEQAGKDRNHDFEELLWGEVRDHLGYFKEGYDLCVERGRRLQGYNLWESAQEHYDEMLHRYNEPDRQLQTKVSLGFVISHQGRVEDARRLYESCLESVLGSEYLDVQSQIYNNLGQLERSAGRWEDAQSDFNQAVDAAQRARKNERLIDALINRSFLYCLKGQYRDAMDQCDNALDLLESVQDRYFKQQRSIYAYRNKGTIYRHSDDFDRAIEQYQESLRIAEEMDNENAICDVTEQIGITYHLRGRSQRRKEFRRDRPSLKNFQESIRYQILAWKHLSRALDIARRTNSLLPTADGLNRLAKLFREVYQLEVTFSSTEVLDEAKDEFKDFIDGLLTFDNTFELEFQENLVIPGQFKELGWLAKAERLFEISALIADQVHDNYRTLDSLTETARMLMWIGPVEKAETIITRMQDLCRREGQPQVFQIITETTIAHLAFAKGEYDIALERFIDSFGRLANTSGYADYMFTDRLRDLEWRLKDLVLVMKNPQMAAVWCNILEEAWQKADALDHRPDMLHMLERTRMLIDAYVNPA